MCRILALLDSSLESEYENKIFIMASHADTLQIFQAYMNCSDVRKFSQYRFRNGEVSLFSYFKIQFIELLLAEGHGDSSTAGASHIPVNTVHLPEESASSS